MSDVNILVLGAEGSGKTCFMLAMYDDMRTGYAGFTFSATDLDLDRSLVMRFETLFDTTGKDRWPFGTDDFSEYEFNLNYAMRKFMVFNWFDYKGAIIKDREQGFDELRDLVEKSHIVMICCPGDLLFKASAGGSRRSMLIAETQQLVEILEGRGHSIVLLVTKADLFAKAYRAANEGATIESANAAAIDAIKDCYHPFFAPRGQWRAMVCPITLGYQLADNENDGEIDPMNMHLPVMFAYHEYARMLGEEWRSRISTKEDEISDLGRGIKSWFNRGRRQEALSDLQGLEKMHSEVQERLSIAKERLKNAQFFVDGEKSSLT